jgi:hypothetical protein
MRLNAFAQKCRKYGQTVTIHWKPDTSDSNKCSCWQDGYPDPDCTSCTDGYVTVSNPTTVKAFVQDYKKRLGERVVENEQVDTFKKGRKRMYFLPAYDPTEMDYVVFNSKHYRVLEYGEWLVGDTMVYRWAVMEVVD